MIAYDGAWKITSSSEQVLPRGTTTTIVVCVVFRGIIASVSRTHISGRVSMCSSWSNFTAIVSFNSVIDAASIDPNLRIALPSLLTDFPAILSPEFGRKLVFSLQFLWVGPSLLAPVLLLVLLELFLFLLFCSVESLAIFHLRLVGIAATSTRSTSRWTFDWAPSFQ